MNFNFNIIIIIFFICINYVFCNNNNTKLPSSTSPDIGNPLFLTPYIKTGNIFIARQLARVQNLSPEELVSYSGFITVNETYNANIFFWFFPAQKSPSTAPVILWCEGGPGVSGLYSLFNENGPYVVDKFGNLSLREYSWDLEYNIIFTDNPIDIGFSFSSSDASHLKSGTDATHMYNFLIQFYTMFPEYQKNDFYASGVSFGGIFAPSIAYEIHQQNNQDVQLKINLKGLILESPWSDPIRQVDYGEFLYHIGLIDQIDREYINQQMRILEIYFNSEKWGEAEQIWDSTISNEKSYFFNLTGLNYNILYNYIGHEEDKSQYYISFIEQEFVRNAIHVGNTKYIPVNGSTQGAYEDKGFKSVKQYIETLLNATNGYRILFYTGQLDIIANHLGVRNMTNGLQWYGAQEFRNTRSVPWKANGIDVSGYTVNAYNLTYVFMRNAGHDANTDQPAWGFDIVSRFTKNLPFTN